MPKLTLPRVRSRLRDVVAILYLLGNRKVVNLASYCGIIT